MKSKSVKIGALIHAELIKQNHTVAWLSDRLGMQRPNCYRIIRATSMNTERLFRISEVLQHDFFADYSKALKEVLI